MHFSIPDTSEIADKGSSFTVFNIHINGAYHCSVRYRQLHGFHEQLKKEFGSNNVPNFPPKRLLSLSPSQLEERRCALERYIQLVSQNPQISTSSTFNGFLLSAQQESQQEEPEDVALDICLLNGHSMSLTVSSTDQTDDVLEAVASQIQLQEDFVYYFALFLVMKEEGQDHTIVRKLQEFESPYISLKSANRSGPHRIMLRKSYWDHTFDDDLLSDRVATNLLYTQHWFVPMGQNSRRSSGSFYVSDRAVNDIERGWVLASKDEHRQLASLQQKGSKKEYLRFARTLKYYGYLQFNPCIGDYPQPDCRVVVSAGSKELSLRLQTNPDEPKEALFRVTRMRCWRITTTIPDIEDYDDDGSAGPTQLELAFEYLVAKDTLQWITIYSDQAILMSMCLQGMVDELIMKKEGRKIKRPQDRRRDGPVGGASRETRREHTPPGQFSLPSPPPETTNGNVQKRTPMGKVSKFESETHGVRISGRSTQNHSGGMSENYAFEGIGDDDL